MALQVELPSLVIDDVIADVTPARPTLVNRDPEPGERHVPATTAIALDIVDVGPDGIDRLATQIYVTGQLAYDGAASPELRPGFDGPRGLVVETADTLSIRLDPVTPLASLQVVAVRVVSATRGPGLLLDRTHSFTVEDLSAPIVVGAQAVAAKRVRVAFDEPVRQVGDGAAGDALDPARYAFSAVTAPAVGVRPVAVVPSGPSAMDVELDVELSPRGRYRVTVSGVQDRFGNVVDPAQDTAEFDGFVPPSWPAPRRFELLRLLPEHNRRADETGDLRRFMAVLQDVVDVLLADVDRFTEIIDPDSAPEPFLDAMLEDLGNPFTFELNTVQKRRLVSLLVQIYKQKGTPTGIQNAIRFFAGVDVAAIDAFHGTTLVLGESELGVEWILGPSDRFALYAFNIEVNRVLTELERRQIREIVEFMKPGHTHFIDLISPTLPPHIDHWELGLSELGESTDLHEQD